MAVGLQRSGDWLAARHKRGAATNVPRRRPITAAL